MDVSTLFVLKLGAMKTLRNLMTEYGLINPISLSVVVARLFARDVEEYSAILTRINKASYKCCI